MTQTTVQAQTQTNGHATPAAALAPAIQELHTAQTSLVAVCGLLEMFSRRSQIAPSMSTVEYLLEAYDNVAGAIQSAILTYARASGLAADDIDCLRAALDMEPEP